MIFNVFLILPQLCTSEASKDGWLMITEWLWKFFETRSQNGPISAKWKHQSELIFCILRLFHKHITFDTLKNLPVFDEHPFARNNFVHFLLVALLLCYTPFSCSAPTTYIWQPWICKMVISYSMISGPLPALCLRFFTCFRSFWTFLLLLLFLEGKINNFHGWGVFPSPHSQKIPRK